MFIVACRRVASIAAIFALFTATTPTTVHGGILFLNPSESSEDSVRFKRLYRWGFAGVIDEDSTRSDGVDWMTTITDRINPAGRALTATVQHRGAFPPNPGSLFGFSFPDVTSPIVGTNQRIIAKQAAHDQGLDIASASLRLPSSSGLFDADLLLKGNHHYAPVPFTWSLKNPAAGSTLSGITVTPSYREILTQTPFDGAVIRVPDLPAGQNAPGRPTDPPGELPLSAMNPMNGKTGRLVDYTIDAVGSNRTVTTLAFIGEVDGMLSKLDLDAATLLFVDFDEFLVPLLRSRETDLFIFVDLTQWLNPLGDFIFDVGETFHIIDGESPELPGFLISTSPVDFLAGVGFLPAAGSLFTGDATAVATIDGRVIPEPPPLAVFGVGTLVVLGYRWRRHRYIGVRFAATSTS